MATVIPQVSIADLVFNKSTPDTVGALQAGLNLSGTFQDQRRATQQEQALLGQQQLAGQASQELLSGNQSPQALAQLMGQNPEMAGRILKQAGIFNQQGRDELARTAFEIESIPAGPQRNARIQEVAEQLKARGGNPNIALGLLNLDGPAQDRQLQNMQLTAMSAEDRQGIAEGTRSFDLQERQFRLNQANVASQIGTRTKSAALQQKIFEQGAKKAEAALSAGVQIDAKGRRSINNDVTGLLKDTNASHSAARSLSKLNETASPTDQLAAIFQFMKSLDPTSVVREGEQQLARSTGGPVDALVGMINQAQGEGGLTETAFANMVDTARSIANSNINSASLKVADYLGAYETTLPESFKIKLQERVPTKFSVIDRTKPTVTPAKVGRFTVEEVK